MGKILYDWNGKEIGVQPDKGENPMLVYGYANNGEKCATCAHFHRVMYHGKSYTKCDLRKWTHGAGTDQKASWPACGKYEATDEL